MNNADFPPWDDKISGLPHACRVVLPIEPNHDMEELTCMICNRGETGGPHQTPEWVVTLRAPGQRIVRGLHERCRVANTVAGVSNA